MQDVRRPGVEHPSEIKCGEERFKTPLVIISSDVPVNIKVSEVECPAYAIKDVSIAGDARFDRREDTKL